MIRPLRTTHRRVISLLAVAVPLVLGAGLLVRRPTPPPARLPADLVPAVPLPTTTLSSRGASGRLQLDARLVGPATPDGPPRLSIEILIDPGIPDLIVYWAPTGDRPCKIPDDAFLVGPVGGERAVLLELPTAARETAGKLVFYSLAHQKVVDEMTLPTIGTPADGAP